MTVCGAPGIGKTRLTIEALSGTDRVVFCDATEIDSLAGLRTEVARTLEHEADDVGPDLLRPYGRLILVVDNFDELVDSSASQIAEWLAHAPLARCVLTSRRRLAMDGERVLTLEPLPLGERGDALELLIDRASLVRGDLDEVDRAELLTVARLLDGLPLALELAAARLRACTPTELRRELELGVTSELASNVSLETSLELSLRRLSAEQRRALGMLTVLRGSFSAHAARSIAEIDDDTLDALSEHSLLVREMDKRARTTRYRLLLSVKQVAARSLDSELRAAAEERHSEVFLHAFVERAIDRDPKLELASLSMDLGNIELVFERAIGREPARAVDRRRALQAAILAEEIGYEVRGVADGRRIEAALARIREGDVDAETLAVALGTRAVIRARRGATSAPIDDIERALSLPTRARVRARVLVMASVFHMLRAEHAPARALLEEALGACAACALPHLEGKVRTHLGRVLARLELVAEGIEQLEQAVRSCREGQFAYGLALALAELATCYVMAGRPAEGLARLEQAPEASCATASTSLDYHIIARRGLAAWMLGDASTARRCWETIAADVTRPHDASVAWTSLALAYACSGDVKRTARAVASALELMEAVKRPHLALRRRLLEAHIPLAEARSAVKSGDLARAAQAHDAASRCVDELAAEVAQNGTGVLVRAHALLKAELAKTRVVRTGAIRIAANAEHFVLPTGETVELARRPTLVRALRGLVEECVRAPGRVVTKAEIAMHGWPEERMSDESALGRIYVAMSTLRKLGLGEALRASDGGYWLDPDKIEIVGDAGSDASEPR